MKKFLLIAMTGFVLGFSGTSFAADDDKPKPTPEDQFKRLDKDKDGSLTLEEFKGKRKDEAATKAEAAFKKMDKDNDQKLSLEEFKSGMKKKGS